MSYHHVGLAIVLVVCILKHDLVLLPLFLNLASTNTIGVDSIVSVVRLLGSHAARSHKLRMKEGKAASSEECARRMSDTSNGPDTSAQGHVNPAL